MFVVELTFDKDEERRLALRPAHREMLRALHEKGALVMAGPFADDTGALLIFRTESRDELMRLLDADPYTHEDVLTRTSIREWAPIVGLSG
jgi:uncharacterized protein